MKKYYYFVFCFLFVLAIAFLQSNILIKNDVSAEDETYIQISSAVDLNKIGVDASYSLNSNYRLTADIDFSNGIFLPIGLHADEVSGAYIVSNPFTGIFDGNGYKIKNVQLTNKTYSYYNLGIFAYTQNATIKNLAVENIKIERTSVYPNNASNQSIVYASGLVGLAESTIIDQCYVSFNASLISGTTSIYYGGLVAKAYAGSSVTNSYAISNFTNNLSGEQAIEVKMGGLVGVLENSQIKVAHSKGSIFSSITSEGQLTPITKSAIGGIAGYVSGYNSKIISTYVDMSVYGETTNTSAENLIGGLVGLIAQNPASTPNKDNLNYAQIMTKTLNKVSDNYVIVQLNQPFGQINYYDSATSTLNLLSQNNFEVFNNNAFWSQYVGEYFDKDYIWTLNADSLPTLQIFTTYQILLKEEETRVNLGENSPDAEVVSLQFVQENPNCSFRYGQQVEILISLINGYDYYYYLESVEFSLDTKVTVGATNENYSVVQLGQDNITIPENLTSEKVYLLSYVMSDSTIGDISVTLNKVSFVLSVETADENMGLVRKKDSTVARTVFTQDLQNANTYDFFAVALNNDYAFSKWVFVAQDDGEETVIEMGDYASFAQLTFVFGIGGTDEVTENILAGAKLVAMFTSNVTKVQFYIQVQNQENGTGAGYISTTIGGEAIDTSNLITFQKDIAATFIANANNGYVFEGWYDGDNRSLSNDTNPTTLNFIPSEDEQILIARFRVADQTVNLTWLWIVLGVIGSVGIGFGIFFIIRSKTGDRAYRNFY